MIDWNISIGNIIEIGTIVVLAQPIGWLIGTFATYGILTALATDFFRIPVAFEKSTYAIATLIVVGAGLVPALIVRRRIDRLDLVRVLKSRE